MADELEELLPPPSKHPVKKMLATMAPTDHLYTLNSECMLGLFLCVNVSAQVNFFECAKNPDKCRPPPSSSTSESRFTGRESDPARLEEELQKKITAELERREKERMQTKVENAEPAKPTIDKSIRIAAAVPVGL